MPLLEFQQLRQPRHRAVFIQDLAEHARRAQPREPRQVHARLRVPRAPQDAPLLRAQRKDVPRLHQIARRRLEIGERADGLRAILRADARRHAFRRIDRDGEIGAIALAILHDHARQPEPLRALLGDRHADEPAPMRRHEVDRLGGDHLRRHDQVALVLAIRIIRDDDHPPRAQIAEHIVDGIENRFSSSHEQAGRFHGAVRNFKRGGPGKASRLAESSSPRRSASEWPAG